ncbi:MAG: hypothetical protein IPH08_04430 [Rhodocyclaceae bacterium]|nr:hypothetical protein [Rhodocyclaceae bacterium]
MPDFRDVIGNADVPMTAPMQQAIMESDAGPLAYYPRYSPGRSGRHCRNEVSGDGTRTHAN